MAAAHLYRRFAEAVLLEALADTPAVLIHGPRQCGKTTLVRRISEARGYAYFSFDDAVTLAAAQADPVGFVGDLPEQVVLDEVQRAPMIFPALKSSIDRRRTPGRFLLTGSANVLLLPALADSLAGRLGLLRLLGDTGLACALLGTDAAGLWQDRTVLGQMLETFVYQELRRHSSWHDGEIRISHFRDKDGAEVDLVLERGSGQIAGVEVKAAATVTAADFRGLRKLKEATGRKFAAGVVLYDGEISAGFGEGMHAVPIQALWEQIE